MKARLFALLLAVSLSMTSIPVTARAEEMTSESVSENTTVGILEDQTQKNQECIDIYSLDWKTASTDEINDAVYAADFVDLGNWLDSMPKDERNELLKKDTYLHNKVQVLSADPSGNGYTEVSGNEDPELWEFSMAQAQMETGEDVSVQTSDAGIAVQSEDDAIDATGAGTATSSSPHYFTKTTGQYYYNFYINGVCYSYKMAISDISKTMDITCNSDTVSIALVSPSGVPGWLSFSSTAGTTDTSRKLKPAWRREGGFIGYYATLRNGVNFTKPAGYTCTYSYSENTTSSWMYYYDSGNYEQNQRLFNGSTNSTVDERINLLAYVHLTDTGVSYVNSKGTVTKASTGNTVFNFVLSPISYTVGYQPNGATSGSVPAQSCVYGQTYTPSANTYDRTYSIVYDANGGSATKASENVSYDFAGWGWENSGAVTHTIATAFANLTTVNGGTAGSFYAIWKPKGTVLPTASRTGYQFLGWYSNPDTTIYDGGTTYTPVGNTLMTAKWKPNHYTVKYNGNGVENIASTSEEYGTYIKLPKPERAGYTFQGWTYNGRTYAYKEPFSDAINLTDKGGDTVEMTAQWQANTDTPYKVMHMVEVSKDVYEQHEDIHTKQTKKDQSNENKIHYYIEKETEDLTGTTGEKVVPTTKSYPKYSFYMADTAEIAGDGSTIVKCYYNRVDSEFTTYRVEHYLQSKEDTTKYILDETKSSSYRVEVGSSVTPDVVTTYEGYNIPNPQTVNVADDGSTVVKYYYTLKDADKSTGNSSGSGTNTGSHVKESSSSDSDNAYSDNNNFKSGEIKYYTDAEGNIYTIYINPDGTVTVMNIKPAKSASSKLSVTGTIIVNGFKYQVSEIAPYAFKNNKKIKTVTIGKGITKIGKGAFYGCTKLKTVKGCQTLKEIGSLAFYKCTSLEKMASSKPLETIGSKAFYNCKKLKKYTIGKYTKNVGSYAFYNCKKLKSITVSESVEIIGKRAFYGCKNLKKVDMKTTKLLKVGSAAFKKCNKNIKFILQAKTAKKYKKLLRNKS